MNAQPSKGQSKSKGRKLPQVPKSGPGMLDANPMRRKGDTFADQQLSAPQAQVQAAVQPTQATQPAAQPAAQPQLTAPAVIMAKEDFEKAINTVVESFRTQLIDLHTTHGLRPESIRFQFVLHTA